MATDIEISALGAYQPSEDGFRALLAAQDSLGARFLDLSSAAFTAEVEEGLVGFPNIVGSGLGVKQRDAATTETLCVKVYVREKLTAAQVAGESLIPEQIDGVPTDVEEVGDIAALSFKSRLRPVPGGVSSGNCTAVMAGTLGCFVEREGELFALSNNHVFALTNASPSDAEIPQPGRLDGGLCPRDSIAVLGPLVPLDFGPGGNLVDAALARIEDPSLADRRIIRPLGRREALVSPHVAPALQMSVMKSGRTTGFTRGLIDAVRVTLQVQYGTGVATFSNQFRVSGTAGLFSNPGDSGSLVTSDPGNQPVGLLFAGGNGFTFCNDIDQVLVSLAADIAY